VIGYTTLGVSDMERSKKFYCDLLEEQGAKAQFDGGRIAMIGKSMSQPMAAVCEPYNGKPGQRIPNIFYGAYIRDQDGNKFAFWNLLKAL